MPSPSVTGVRATNRQLRNVQSLVANLSMSGPDETAYKAALTALYSQEIADARIHAPGIAPLLAAELASLLTLTDTQLAALNPRYV